VIQDDVTPKTISQTTSKLIPITALFAINTQIVGNPEVIRKQAPGIAPRFPLTPDRFCLFQCSPARKLPANAGLGLLKVCP